MQDSQGTDRLNEVRTQIDMIDRGLIEQLLERGKRIDEVARIKTASSLPIFDPEREQRQMLRVNNICQELNAPAHMISFVEFIFQHVALSSKILQGDHHPPSGPMYCPNCKWTTGGEYIEGFDWPRCSKCRRWLDPIPTLGRQSGVTTL